MVPAIHLVSIPRRSLLSEICLIHDVLLEDGYRVAFADSQWFEAVLSEDADPLKSRLAYLAMRMRRFWR